MSLTRLRAKARTKVDEDGVIGSDFLSLFDVYLDYEDSRIYLVPTNSTRRFMGKVK